MLVRKLTVDGFRNLHTATFTPCPGVNILYGDNAQGKTNFLEACWLFTGSRSFRGARDSELVGFAAPRARLEMAFFAAGREQEATVTVENRRAVTLNGVRLPSANKLAGVFCGTIFSPEHLSLVKNGPEERRRFVDAAYCQIKPGYHATVAEFQRVMTQRNALLRRMAEKNAPSPADREMLALWDQKTAAAGARLTVGRQRYIDRLRPLAEEIYAGLSGDREKLSVAWVSPAYTPDATPAQVAANWLTLLQDARRADMAVGHATAGAHREDMQLLLDGTPLRAFGSQGQQRSAVLALKLAEATLLQETAGEPPVTFLDDVMSELDPSRQDYILNHIRDWQVFITCCEPTTALRMTAGQAFFIKQGVITEQ